MGDAKDGCFSSLCMGELFGDTLFFGLEYGVSLFDVANLEGMKYPHFWGCWEIYWSFEVFASWDIVWVVSYLGFYAMYFCIWFPAICLCFFVIFFFFFLVFVSSTVYSSSWTWSTFLLMLPIKKNLTKSKLNEWWHILINVSDTYMYV